MDKKKVLILSYSPLASDPRIQRQIFALKDDFIVETSGFGGNGHTGIPFHPIYTAPVFSLVRKLKRAFQFFSRRFESYYWDEGKRTLVQQLRPNMYDVVISNDIQTLPLALAIARGNTKIYFDAHEFHPKEFDENLNWRVFHKPYITYLCKTYISRAHVFSTVSEGIAQAYLEFTGLKPIVITNATPYKHLQPSTTRPSSIRLIHHGAALPGRKLEQMIEMMDLLDTRYSFYFMLAGHTSTYLKELKKKASKNQRIHFVPPVISTKICEEINQYDIGIYILPPTNFNNLHALPNKFFEFIQARLCIALAPSPEMEALTKKYDLGIIADDFSASSMADCISALTVEKISHYKMQAHLHAKHLSDETNVLLIKNIINGLVS